MKMICSTTTAAVLLSLALTAARADEPVDEAPSVSAATRARATVDNACSICHGERGISRWTYVPSLAGQDKDYLVDQLKGLRARNRTTNYSRAAMWGMTANLKDEDIDALAEYYSKLEPAHGRAGESERLALGRKVFERHELGRPACATCHSGGRPADNLPRLAGQHADYVARALREFRRGARLNSTMSFMAADLTDPEIDAVAAYVESLNGGEDSFQGAQISSDAAQASSAERGRALFRSAGCFQCHGDEGKGGVSNPNAQGGLVPTLTLVAQGYSDAELKDKIRRGVRVVAKADPSGPAPRLFMPAWGRFLSDRQIDDLAVYLKSLGAGQNPGDF
jgi:cytochrome c553